MFDSYKYIEIPLKRVNEEIEKVFKQKFFPAVSPLYREGKRLRSALTLFTSHAFDNWDENLIHLAASVELIHFSSLIHDDVVDEAEKRRNYVALNRLLGNHAAVLIGDYVFSTAIYWISLTGNPLLFKEISCAVLLMCEGEMLEEFTKREDTFDEDYYFDLIYKKTGALFESASMLGAIHRGDISEKYRVFGKNFGILYQVLDDLIDFLEGEDVRQGKVTLPLIYAKKEIFNRFPEFKFKKDGFDEIEMKKIVLKGGGIEKAIEKSRSIGKEIEKIMDNFHEPLRRILKKFVSEVYEYAFSLINNYKEV